MSTDLTKSQSGLSLPYIADDTDGGLMCICAISVEKSNMWY